MTAHPACLHSRVDARQQHQRGKHGDRPPAATHCREDETHNRHHKAEQRQPETGPRWRMRRPRRLVSRART